MRRHILIVEDHAMFRDTLRRFLMTRYPGAEISAAENGQIGVELCRQKRPDVVVMDVNMPVLDGLKACEQIKNGSPGTPVVLYSSEQLPDSAAAHSGDAFITKQFVFEQLPNEIAELLPDSSSTSPPKNHGTFPQEGK